VDAHLSTLTKTGHAELATPPPADDSAKALRPGDLVADAALVDQDGKAKTLASLRGHRVALTFIYTRCPLPDYCPLMNRNFAAMQKELKSRPRLADVRLMTITMDPEYDTPKVLKPLADALDADPVLWSFVTGQPDEIKSFGQQFGVYVERDPQDAAQLIHNLRTAVIGADGRLIKIESGNSWMPADLVADLEAASPATH
jgi:protein SCO1/2